MWELKSVLYFGIISVPVPVPFPHKYFLIRPSPILWSVASQRLLGLLQPVQGVTLKLLLVHWATVRPMNATNIMPLQRGIMTERIHTKVQTDTFMANIANLASEAPWYTYQLTEVRNSSKC